MRIFFVLLILSTSVFAKEEKKKELPKDMSPTARKFLEDAPEEDCEEKAKKPIVIPVEEPVLGLGDAGCSIEDM